MFFWYALVQLDCCIDCTTAGTLPERERLIVLASKRNCSLIHPMSHVLLKPSSMLEQIWLKDSREFW